MLVLVEWLFLVWLVKQSRVRGLQCITFFLVCVFGLVFFITVAEICLCRKWPIKELLGTKWFFVPLHEICLKATDCEGEISCCWRFSPLWSQLITWGLICVLLQHAVDTGVMKHALHCLVCSHIRWYDTCFYKHWSGKVFPCRFSWDLAHDWSTCRCITGAYSLCISGEDGGQSPTVLNRCHLGMWTCYLTLGQRCKKSVSV